MWNQPGNLHGPPIAYMAKSREEWDQRRPDGIRPDALSTSGTGCFEHYQTCDVSDQDILTHLSELRGRLAVQPVIYEMALDICSLNLSAFVLPLRETVLNNSFL